MYHFGSQGFPVDLAKAVEFYKLAAEQDHAAACLNLGAIYYSGECVGGITKETQLAYHYISKAASLGHAAAHFTIGKMHEKGVGAKKE